MYSWNRGGGAIPKKAKGKNSAKLTIPSVVPEDEGEYYCVGEKFGHCAKADNIVLTVDGEIIVQCRNYVAIGFYIMVCFK